MVVKARCPGRIFYQYGKAFTQQQLNGPRHVEDCSLIEIISRKTLMNLLGRESHTEILCLCCEVPYPA
jgi:hypothetical protein